jgi:hypothetical protein
MGAGKGSGAAAPFPLASVHFEQNATDEDVEVVFRVKGGKEGLAKLTVVAPDGRTVIDFTAPNASTLGIRQFRFETPEPRDIKGLKSAYPEGVYTFSGATAAGATFHGQATLNHKLPPTVSFLQPNAGARGVSTQNLQITWTPVKNLAAHIITIKGRKVGEKLQATLPGSAAMFAVPEGFLRPGTEYQLAIGTVSDEGNTSFVETTFTTAGGP